MSIIDYKNRYGIYFSIYLCLCVCLFLQSCFPPNGFFDKSKTSNCLYLNTEKFEIDGTCLEKKEQKIVSISVRTLYDSIKIIDGQPSNGYISFEKSVIFSLPFSLDTIVKDRSLKNIIVLKTNVIGYEYSILLEKKGLNKGLLPFTYLYRN